MSSKKPTEVDFSERRIPDVIWEAINESLRDEYDSVPSGYSIELKVTNIDWDEDEDYFSEVSKYNHLSEQYALSARVYFDILKMALYRCEGIVAKTSIEVAEVIQNMPTDCERVYKIANNIVEAMYGGNK